MTYTASTSMILFRIIKNRSKINVLSAFNNPGLTTTIPVLAMFQKITSDLNLVHPEAKTLITVGGLPIEG